MRKTQRLWYASSFELVKTLLLTFESSSFHKLFDCIIPIASVGRSNRTDLDPDLQRSEESAIEKRR